MDQNFIEDLSSNVSDDFLPAESVEDFSDEAQQGEREGDFWKSVSEDDSYMSAEPDLTGGEPLETETGNLPPEQSVETINRDQETTATAEEQIAYWHEVATRQQQQLNSLDPYLSQAQSNPEIMQQVQRLVRESMLPAEAVIPNLPQAPTMPEVPDENDFEANQKYTQELLGYIQRKEVYETEIVEAKKQAKIAEIVAKEARQKEEQVFQHEQQQAINQMARDVQEKFDLSPTEAQEFLNWTNVNDFSLEDMVTIYKKRTGKLQNNTVPPGRSTQRRAHPTTLAARGRSRGSNGKFQSDGDEFLSRTFKL